MAQVMLTNRFQLYIHPFMKNSDVNGVLCPSKSSLRTRLELGSGLHFPMRQGLFKWSSEVCVCLSLDAEISSKSRRAMQKKARRWKKKRGFLGKHLWYVSFQRTLVVSEEESSYVSWLKDAQWKVIGPQLCWERCPTDVLPSPLIWDLHQGCCWVFFPPLQPQTKPHNPS